MFTHPFFKKQTPIYAGFHKITSNPPIDCHALILSSQEQQVYPTITHTKKKKEWVTARFLLQKLLFKKGLPYFGLQKNVQGVPSMVHYPWGISISHSYPFVVVMIHKQGKIGTDIQTFHPKIKKIQNRFLHPKEYLHQDDLQKLTIIWAAKETIYKLYNKNIMSFQKDIYVDPFTIKQTGKIKVWVQNQPLTLYYKHTPYYVWCYGYQNQG